MTLPSVSAIRALRRFGRAARAERPFLGIGDPKLKGAGGDRRGVSLSQLFARGAVADVEMVREMPSLPETASELSAIATSLHVDEGSLVLGAAATETYIKQLDLVRYRTIAFATHALVAGDLPGVAEPALVLTPPAEGSPTDDGLLTSSEIARLTLDSDWVILSACNTAAGDGTPGAVGLSGLAKAFFFAGTRSLLVSHWPVVSEAAVQLTTGTFEVLASEPGMTRAEVLRRSMMRLLDDPPAPHVAHPMFWAPFVVIGEGGTFAVN